MSSKMEFFGKQIKAAFENELLNNSLEAADYLLEKTKPNVPVDSGDLINSGFVKKTNDGAMVVFDKDYAKKIHEDMRLNHVVGKAKYLEDTLNEEQDKILKIMAKGQS